jgi:hypothetical protein
MQLNLVPQVYAQEESTACAPGEGGLNLGNCLRLSDDTPVSEVYTNPAFLVNLLVRNIFIIGGVVLFIMIIIAGFKFVTKGKEGAQEAQQMLTYSVLGFIIMFSAYWIVQIIALLTGADISL